MDPDLLRARVMALVDLWRRGESIRARETSVHERERAALLSAVQQTEAELRLIIDGVRDHAISLLDDQGRIRTFNTPAERIKGYALAEVQGRHFPAWSVRPSWRGFGSWSSTTRATRAS
jgi:PAS domain-containing protein